MIKPVNRRLVQIATEFSERLEHLEVENTALKWAITRMEQAGGSHEFQRYFDIAKEMVRGDMGRVD